MRFKDATFVFFVQEMSENDIVDILTKNNFKHLYHFENEELASLSIIPDFVVLDTDYYMQKPRVKKVRPLIIS